jgi:hypothetical protein
MKNNTFLLLAVSFLVSANCMAQKEDHLVPVEWGFSMYESQYEHYANVRSILFKGLKEYPEARFLVIPSFETEYVWQVEYDFLSRKSVIVVKMAKVRIEDSKKKSKIKVETWRNSLSGSDVNLIVSLFSQAIAGVKYPEVRSVMNYDNTDLYEPTSFRLFSGVKYYFSYSDHFPMEQRTGVTWSPDKATEMGRLVDIATKLTEWAKSDKGTVVLPDELKTAIVILTNDLKNSAN